MKFLTLILFCCFLSIPVLFANESDHDEKKEHREENEGHHEEAELPSGITSFDDESGEFGLKTNVIANYGIKFGPTGSVISSQAIVRSLLQTTVFIHRSQKFIEVPVKIIISKDDSVTVSYLKEIHKGDELVISGTNFLKTIHLALEEGPSEGHGH